MPGGRRRFDRLSEATVLGADIRVICGGCGHRELFDRATFLAVLADKRLGDDRERIARRMTCRTCYRRGAILELVAEGSPLALRLRDDEPLPPRGISLSDWCRAGTQQRRRLIRQARD